MRKLACLLALTMAVLVAPAHAATVDEARAKVSAVAHEALDVIKTKSTKQAKQKKLESLFATNVDIPWVGRFVLGRYWRTASDAQKTRYIKEYEGFVVTHYASRFAEYSGGDFKIVNTTDDGDGEFTVSMEMLSDNTQVAVDYRLHEVDGALKIFDVVVEGVSMIATQRSEFASVVGNKNLDYLIDQLANRTLEHTNAEQKKS